MVGPAEVGGRWLLWDGTISRVRSQRWAVKERGQRESFCPSGTWSEMEHREARYWTAA